jgi:glutathione S-transferase
LVETYGNGRLCPAAGTPERLRYNYWMNYAEGSAMPLLVMKLIFAHIPEAPQMPRLLRPIARMITGGFSKSYLDPQLKDHVALWDAELAKSAYFAGAELTGADIMMSFPLEAASARATLAARLSGYLAGIHARPAYQAALARGGPYELAAM